MSDIRQEKESKALGGLLDQLKSEKGVTKAIFAKRHKIPGGASMISQHLSGHRPISLDQAIAYVSGLNKEGITCTIRDISQRLHDGVERARYLEADHIKAYGAAEGYGEGKVIAVDPKTHQTVYRWPFSMVTAEDVERLSTDNRHTIEVLIKQLLEKISAKHRPPEKKPRAAKSA